jgi:nucleoside-diphosphate-sugar epimerase
MMQAAVMGEKYTCYLDPDTPLSMVYTEDAVNATVKLMEARPENLSIRTSYNIHAMNFTPLELVEEIRKYYPKLEVDYKSEEVRQYIANSWPHTFVDEKARSDWGWTPKFNLEEMVKEIFRNLTPEVIRSLRPAEAPEKK